MISQTGEPPLKLMKRKMFGKPNVNISCTIPLYCPGLQVDALPFFSKGSKLRKVAKKKKKKKKKK